MTKYLVAIVSTVLLALPAAASDSKGFSAGGGIGFTEGMFLLSLEAPYSIDDHFSIGPLLQLGLEENVVLVMASANARYAWNVGELLSDSSEAAHDSRVFLQGGLGISHMDISVNFPAPLPDFNADDTAFLINFGFGAEYDLTASVSLTSQMLFNIHAGDLFNDTFSFSWQVIGARYRF